MAEKAVFGIAKNESQAIVIADNLKAAGFAANDVSVLFPDKTGTRDFAHEQHTKAPEVRLLAPAQARSWAELWAGWLASALWQFPALVLSSQRVPSWPPWLVRPAAPLPVD